MNKAATIAIANKSFTTRLGAYKQTIDVDIARYSKSIRRTTLEQYGTDAQLEIDAYLSILARGGKRIRGALTILGYEMCGGKDKAMILEAARAVEMIHAYILIIDDIQDRSLTRRGGPTAHKMLEQYHRDHSLASDADHFGIAIALNSGLLGSHVAQMILANLNVSESYRIKALNILNRTLMVTAHGQSSDLMNEMISDVQEDKVERVMEWKTAHYTILNPIHMGMVLAGADCASTDAITDYAIQTGKAFQITDDILGTFGEEYDSGKSPQDDIKEGKRTLLTVYALSHTSNGNKNFLIQMLGNRQLTPEEFLRVKEILVECGALKYARSQAEQHARAALKSLEKHKSMWDPEGVAFLEELVKYLLVRTS